MESTKRSLKRIEEKQKECKAIIERINARKAKRSFLDVLGDKLFFNY